MFFNNDIITMARLNTYFRKELITTHLSQVVLMALQPAEDIGQEAHKVDQILFFVEGEGEAVLNNEKSLVTVNSLVVVPAGTVHNFINSGSRQLKLFTIYTPPQHKPGTKVVSKKDLVREA
jgi:mannose-6-phosphate isomerase-like protein (cupin superfamily)